MPLGTHDKGTLSGALLQFRFTDTDQVSDCAADQQTPHYAERPTDRECPLGQK